MEDFNIDSIDILTFFQNKINSTKLKQMTKDEKLNPWRPKISCKPAQNFVKRLLLNCFLSLSKMVPRYLSVVQVLLSFAAPPNHCDLSICEREKLENPLLQIQVHKRKGHLNPAAETRQGKNCECYPAHSFLFVHILRGNMLFIHQSTMRIIYCVW